MAASIAIAVTVLVLVAGAVPARDLASPAGPTPAPAATTTTHGAVDRYEAVRRRGAPVAVLKRRVALRAAPSGSARVLARIGVRTEWHSARVLAVSGRRGRWLRVLATELPNGRRGWIPLGASHLLANPWRVRADLSSRTVSVFRRGRLVRRFRVAVGAPATPTPTGRFAVTDKISMSGGGAYGCCAVALTGHQTRIAQGWRGGDRLAIHGTHMVDTIGTAASFGCLRAHDADARFVMRRLYLGTVVTIRR